MDANRDVVHVEVESSKPVTSIAEPIIWRTEHHEIAGDEGHSRLNMFYGGESGDHVERADDEILWYHRNEGSVWRPISSDSTWSG